MRKSPVISFFFGILLIIFSFSSILGVSDVIKTVFHLDDFTEFIVIFVSIVYGSMMYYASYLPLSELSRAKHNNEVYEAAIKNALEVHSIYPLEDLHI